MDLTSLITTIATSIAALVAIIGGLLVSRILSLANDKHFIERQLDDLRINANHKVRMMENIDKFLLEDDLSDFVTDRNLALLIKNKTLEEIIKEEELDYLVIEEIEPYFKILEEIKEEVIALTMNDYFTAELFEKFLNDGKMKHPDRKDWYELMLETVTEINYPRSQKWHNDLMSAVTPTPPLPYPSDYKIKKREREKISYEVEILKEQETKLENSLSTYIPITEIMTGITVLILASAIGIIYPVTLLPYPLNYYDDELTRRFLIVLFMSSFTLIFGYLVVSVHNLTSRKIR